jgi:hypothetical protein
VKIKLTISFLVLTGLVLFAFVQSCNINSIGTTETTVTLNNGIEVTSSELENIAKVTSNYIIAFNNYATNPNTNTLYNFAEAQIALARLNTK